MRLLVTGRNGQLASALLEHARADSDVTVETVGRPEFDLAQPPAPDALNRILRAARPHAVVNAAAYTAVDAAEDEPDVALRVNGLAAGAVAAAAARAGVPIVQISTDYVFDGSKPEPYREDDPTAPLGAYGRSKLEGERLVAEANADHVILRTAWVFAAGGKNFVRTMLRLAETRAEVAVVGDQFGAPTYAPDLAAAVVAVAHNLLARPDETRLRGVFHAAGTGHTDWASFAEAVFAGSRARGGPSAGVRRIGTADYPTPARRPANSRLDGSKLREAHGVQLPPWRDALERCLDRLIADGRVLDDAALAARRGTETTT